MAIHYKIIPRKNPQDGAAPPKYYARAVANGKMNLDALARRIAQNTTIGVGDIHGVLKTLEEAIINALEDGISVELGSLCDIYPTVSGPGADSAETFNPVVNIAKKGINIRPKKNLKQKMANITLVRE